MPNTVLHVLFVCSGFAALLYQMVWQRLLLIIFGSNNESVALVVGAFMLGLGLGNVLGGELSRRFPGRAVRLFALCELLIGIYGLVSIPLFTVAGEWFGQAGLGVTGVAVFFLLLFPTTLMGATLPLLVSHRVAVLGHVGRSVSWLYFVNTLGAALGVWAATFILLGGVWLQGTCRIAMLVNLLCAFVAILVFRSPKTARQAAPATEATFQS